MDKQKIVVFDWLILIHVIGFAKAIPEYSLKYQVLNMMTSYLRKIGLNDNDVIAVARDLTHLEGCWRHDYETNYKHARSNAREKSGRNWELIWRLSEELQEELEWIGVKFLQKNRYEADDFYGVLPQVIKDKELVFVTSDGDIEQMWYYNIVSKCCQSQFTTINNTNTCNKCNKECEVIDTNRIKIFSPKKKYRAGKGAYKIKPDNFDVDKLIAKKSQKEKKDGMENETLTEEEYDNRKLCNDLIRLPEFVTEPLTEEIKKLDLNPNYSWSDIPYWEKWQFRIQQAYSKSNIITYEDCQKYFEKKKEMKKKKDAEIRAKKKANKLKDKSVNDEK